MAVAVTAAATVAVALALLLLPQCRFLREEENEAGAQLSIFLLAARETERDRPIERQRGNKNNE